MVEQPHFDDELTALTARPVVPLEEIEAKIKHRRRWFLGGAFALAMLLGAASALVSAYFKLRNVSDPQTQTTAVSTVPEPEPAATQQPAEASMLPVVEKVDEQPAPSPTATPVPKRPARVITEHTNHPVIDPRVSEEDDLRRIRDSVLVDEWEERRARRVERRERRERRRAQRSGRDLSNLDEIFEGPRRPRS
ncbi:MAG TPA: hypothetical protein VJS13_01500 [Pyrinomonadaceae bacterium]|nr:hypothetical protein [Pyrinomonadaceae bacterium]